jgi:hypothetical protein
MTRYKQWWLRVLTMQSPKLTGRWNMSRFFCTYSVTSVLQGCYKGVTIV